MLGRIGLMNASMPISAIQDVQTPSISILLHSFQSLQQISPETGPHQLLEERRIWTPARFKNNHSHTTIQTHNSRKRAITSALRKDRGRGDVHKALKIFF
jgi:hypothetical protein